jgi:hypothetical protein
MRQDRDTAPLWRLLDSVPDQGWTAAVDMPAAQVVVAEYCPDWWPAATRLVIRRVRLNLQAGPVSSDPRARRRRTLTSARSRSCIPVMATRNRAAETTSADCPSPVPSGRRFMIPDSDEAVLDAAILYSAAALLTIGAVCGTSFR